VRDTITAITSQSNKMIIKILQVRLINVWLDLVVCLLLESRDIEKCSCCGCELDVEDYFLNNICDSCGASQGYDKEYFENFDLNYMGVRCLEI